MKNGLYSVITKGFMGAGLAARRCLSSSEWGAVGRMEFLRPSVLSIRTHLPRRHLYFNARDIGIGLSGAYEGDQAELTATVIVGKRSLTLQLILRKLADI